MKENLLPDFPALLETIGLFLRDAEEKPLDMKKLKAAREALDSIVGILYPKAIQPYLCGRLSRLTAAPLSRAAK